MKVDSTVNISGYEINFNGVDNLRGPNYISSVGNFSVKNNNIESFLRPEKRFYPVEGSVTTEAAILTRYFSHIYIVLGEKINDEEWVVRIWYKPLILLIWIGAIVVALGGTISLFSRVFIKKISKIKLILFIIFMTMPLSSKEITNIANEVNLIESLEILAGQLSHGQKQWLEIGMLSKRPKVYCKKKSFKW